MTRKEPVKAIVTRRFRAVPERVFDAFLDPAKAGRFLFATKAGTIVRAEIDPRVGGAYCFTDRRAGENVEHRGTYVEIDRPRRLVLTLSVDQFGQDHDLVTIEIEPDGTGSALTLTMRWARTSAHTRSGPSRAGPRSWRTWQGRSARPSTTPCFFERPLRKTSIFGPCDACRGPVTPVTSARGRMPL